MTLPLWSADAGSSPERSFAAPVRSCRVTEGAQERCTGAQRGGQRTADRSCRKVSARLGTGELRRPGALVAPAPARAPACGAGGASLREATVARKAGSPGRQVNHDPPGRAGRTAIAAWADSRNERNARFRQSLGLRGPGGKHAQLSKFQAAVKRSAWHSKKFQLVPFWRAQHGVSGVSPSTGMVAEVPLVFRPFGVRRFRRRRVEPLLNAC